MIIENILKPLFLLIRGLISLISYGGTFPAWGIDFLKLMSIALEYFPGDVLVIILCNIWLWISAFLVWTVVEWVYKKVPGVD